jgi:hypothetical protein
MKKLLVLFVIISVSFTTRADEGMWLPWLLQNLNEKEMQSMGMKMKASDIYDIKNGSLKDAICQFGRGCTGEVVSNQGLLITNHHCGFDAITNHSSVQNNLLDNGFWAASKEQELPNPGLTALFVVDVKDVTNDVLQAVTSVLTETERQKLIDANIKAIYDALKVEAGQRAFIRPFFEGNQYFLFIADVFEDVRLVGAPPAAIGQFGKDTDNWVWPRHTGDFSVFRIYADANNRPAKYSPSNKPYIPKKHLSINITGLKQNDFTMVMGFPGRTQQYLPSQAVQQLAYVTNPAKVTIRQQALQVMDNYMRSSVSTKLQYADRYAGIANYWKKWLGEYQGLQQSQAVQKKLAYEKEFENAIEKSELLQADYNNCLTNLNNVYKQNEQLALAQNIYAESQSNSHYFFWLCELGKLLYLYEEGKTAEAEKVAENLSKTIGNADLVFNHAVENDILRKLLPHYFKAVPEQFIGNEALTYWSIADKKEENLLNLLWTDNHILDIEKIKSALKLTSAEYRASYKKNKLINVFKSIYQQYASAVVTNYNNNLAQISSLQRQYTNLQMRLTNLRKIYPDANGTLRVTYGKVNGYQPKDGAYYDYYTYLEGVMEKYIPGDYEFDVPKKLIELYEKKDYGRYAANGKMPVAFIAANHTTGGNSGSPALNAYGHMVGLNFDRVWEGTMSDVNYDVSRCRNIMVDVRYILFIIEKLGGAQHLINEMSIVTNATVKKSPKNLLQKNK